jgi:hypothetical protein
MRVAIQVAAEKPTSRAEGAEREREVVLVLVSQFKGRWFEEINLPTRRQMTNQTNLLRLAPKPSTCNHLAQPGVPRLDTTDKSLFCNQTPSFFSQVFSSHSSFRCCRCLEWDPWSS